MKKKKAGRGRPQKLSKTEKQNIIKLVQFGLTDEQISEAFGITRQTLDNYKKRDPEFFASLKKSKEIADELVEKSLFKRALGYDYKEEFATKDGAVECKKVSHPDVLACIFWLKNRKSKDWKDRHDLGENFNDAASAIAGLFRQRYNKEAPRLAAGEDPSLVLFGRVRGFNKNGSHATSN